MNISADCEVKYVPKKVKALQGEELYKRQK